MTTHSFLKFVAKIRGIPSAKTRESIQWAMHKCGLETVHNRIVETLSKGYRQRLGLAQAVIHKPSVLFFDEPTAGLDPTQIVEIRNLIRELSAERTIMLSTHILPEVSMTCRRIIIINKGRIALDGDMRKLSEKQSLEEIFTNIVTQEEHTSPVNPSDHGLAAVN